MDANKSTKENPVNETLPAAPLSPDSPPLLAARL